MMAVGTIATCCCHKVQPHCLAMAILAVPIADVNWIAAVIRRGPIFNFLLSGFFWVGEDCAGVRRWLERYSVSAVRLGLVAAGWGKGWGYAGSARFREGAWGAWVVDRNGKAWGRCKGSAVRLLHEVVWVVGRNSTEGLEEDVWVGGLEVTPLRASPLTFWRSRKERSLIVITWSWGTATSHKRELVPKNPNHDHVTTEVLRRPELLRNSHNHYSFSAIATLNGCWTNSCNLRATYISKSLAHLELHQICLLVH